MSSTVLPGWTIRRNNAVSSLENSPYLRRLGAYVGIIAIVQHDAASTGREFVEAGLSGSGELGSDQLFAPSQDSVPAQRRSLPRSIATLP